MDSQALKKAFKLYEELKAQGLSPEAEKKILRELNMKIEPHDVVPAPPNEKGIYQYNDLAVLQQIMGYESNYAVQLRSMDELLDRDKQREDDGFPRKVRVGKLIKPGKGGKDKVVVVPSTQEEKFVHHTPSDV